MTSWRSSTIRQHSTRASRTCSTRPPATATTRYQHTIASGLDYVINERLFSTTRVAYQHTHAERTNGEGVPTLAMLGVKSWMYTQGKIPGQDMLQAGLWGSGFTGNFYVDTPQVSQDFDWTLGSHSLVIRRLLDAAELDWRRTVPG